MTTQLDPAPTFVRVYDHTFGLIQSIPAADCLDIQPGMVAVDINHPLVAWMIKHPDEHPGDPVFVAIDTESGKSWRGLLKQFEARQAEGDWRLVTRWAQIP